MHNDEIPVLLHAKLELWLSFLRWQTIFPVWRSHNWQEQKPKRIKKEKKKRKGIILDYLGPSDRIDKPLRAPSW